jgi:enoyl-CoA hydratase/carnithine racemase
VMPYWVIALARGNVRADRLDDLILPGAAVPPEAAVECGFADSLAPPDMVLETALGKARDLAALPRPVYAETKRRLRGAASQTALSGLDRDTREMLSRRP